MLPVISTILSLTEATISTTRKDISEILSEENALENISKQVSTLIYASQANMPNDLLTSFREYVAPGG